MVRRRSVTQLFASGDLSDDRVIRKAARDHSRDGDVIVLLLNAQMAALGYNFVSQLRKLGLMQHLLLAPTEAECTALASVWHAFSETAPPCGWAGALMAHEGWLNFGVNATTDILALYASRWYVSARLTDLGYSVLILDVDAALHFDPLKLLRSRPLADSDVVLTDQGRGSGINCGAHLQSKCICAAARSCTGTGMRHAVDSL